MNDPQRGFVGELADELRRAWRELVGGLRASGRNITVEGRAILRELDAPAVERPGFWRRGWRRFRRTPPLVQILVALAVFSVWAYLVFASFTAPSPAPPHSPTDTGVTV
jgi:hypothetical protein